jgi:hypothetical protein
MKKIIFILLMGLSFSSMSDVITSTCSVIYGRSFVISEHPKGCYIVDDSKFNDGNLVDHKFKSSLGSRNFKKLLYNFKFEWLLKHLHPKKCPKGFDLFEQKPFFSGYAHSDDDDMGVTLLLSVTNTCIK